MRLCQLVNHVELGRETAPCRGNAACGGTGQRLQWVARRQEAAAADVRTAEVAAVMEVTGGTVARAVEKAVAKMEHRLREALTALREAASERETMEAA